MKAPYNPELTEITKSGIYMHSKTKEVYFYDYGLRKSFLLSHTDCHGQLGDVYHNSTFYANHYKLVAPQFISNDARATLLEYLLDEETYIKNHG
jgi:hypothetical protein